LALLPLALLVRSDPEWSNHPILFFLIPFFGSFGRLKTARPTPDTTGIKRRAGREYTAGHAVDTGPKCKVVIPTRKIAQIGWRILCCCLAAGIKLLLTALGMMASGGPSRQEFARFASAGRLTQTVLSADQTLIQYRVP